MFSVCVCVFGIYVLKIVVERIGSLVKLHAWLHSYLCFSFLWKTVFEHLNNFLIPLDNFQSIKPLFSSCLDRSYCNLDPSRFLDFVSIASRQILDQSRNFLSSWQILDPSRLASVDSYSTTSRSIEILLHTLFSHVLHLSFIFSSISSCFITFMHLYGFLVPPWSSLCFSGEAF